jgi:hypothetical protein
MGDFFRKNKMALVFGAVFLVLIVGGIVSSL